jgi:FkbM family methyltransferase
MDNICSYSTKYGNISLYKNETYITPKFEKGNYWDIDTLLMLKMYIDTNKNILEIGAHCGTSTLVYASFLNEGKIYAYEPQSRMFELLKHNINKNNLQDKVVIYNKGLFCYEGRGNMNNIDIDGGGGIIEKRYSNENNMPCNFGGICLGTSGEDIDLVTLDSLEHQNIGFIHCVAQGSESFLFSKGLNLITNFKPFILFSNNKGQNNYLYKEVCKSYPDFYNEANFDLVEYCINNLGYTSVKNFNNSINELLIPPQNNFDKIIHITYKTTEKLLEVKKQWLELNPEYTVMLYDDNNCKRVLLEYFGQLFCDIFDFIKDGPIKSDFFRICILYIYGGIYVDADIKPLIPLNTFLEEDVELCTCVSYNYNKDYIEWAYNPHFIVSKKFNYNLFIAIKKYVEYYKKQIEYSYWGWSICKIFTNINIDFDYKPNDKNIFIYNNKKYQFLLENAESNDNIVLNFNNISEYRTNNNVSFKKCFCSYNNIKVFYNFINKNLL